MCIENARRARAHFDVTQRARERERKSACRNHLSRTHSLSISRGLTLRYRHCAILVCVCVLVLSPRVRTDGAASGSHYTRDVEQCWLGTQALRYLSSSCSSWSSIIRDAFRGARAAPLIWKLPVACFFSRAPLDHASGRR